MGTEAHQAPLSMGFSRQEYWSGYPFPSPGHFPNLGIKPGSPGLQADSLTAKLSRKPTNIYKPVQIIFKSKKSVIIKYKVK